MASELRWSGPAGRKYNASGAASSLHGWLRVDDATLILIRCCGSSHGAVDWRSRPEASPCAFWLEKEEQSGLIRMRKGAPRWVGAMGDVRLCALCDSHVCVRDAKLA